MKSRKLAMETLGSRELLTSLIGAAADEDGLASREAVFDNFVGFYEVVDEDGGIDTAEPVNGDWDADGVDDLGLFVHRETDSTHTYSTGGIYTITVTLTDDDTSNSSEEEVDAFFAEAEQSSFKPTQTSIGIVKVNPKG